MRWLIDTCVLSETCRKHPERKVLSWLEAHDAELALCIFTIAEIRRGVVQAAPTRRAALQHWFDTQLLAYRKNLIPFDEASAEAWAALMSEQPPGTTPPVIDSLIAACARARGLTLATRNTRHFQGFGIETFDPWSGT